MHATGVPISGPSRNLNPSAQDYTSRSVNAPHVGDALLPFALAREDRGQLAQDFELQAVLPVAGGQQSMGALVALGTWVRHGSGRHRVASHSLGLMGKAHPRPPPFGQPEE